MARTCKPVRMACRTKNATGVLRGIQTALEPPFCQTGSRASAGHPVCPTAAPRSPQGHAPTLQVRKSGAGRHRACGSSAWGCGVGRGRAWSLRPQPCPGASPSGCPHSPSMHTGGLGPGETSVLTATTWCPVRCHTNIPSRNLAPGSVGAALCPRLSEDTPHTGASRERHSVHGA